MVRLSRERWYSPAGQQRLSRRAAADSAGHRRVAGMVVLLVLVLLCMRALQDRDNYEPAFRAIGLAKDPDGGDTAGSEAARKEAAREGAAREGAEAAIDATLSGPAGQTLQDFAIWQSLLQELPSAKRRELIAAVLGDAALGDAALGDAVLGDAVLGDAVLGDAVLGDAVLGDAGLAAGGELSSVVRQSLRAELRPTLERWLASAGELPEPQAQTLRSFAERNAFNEADAARGDATALIAACDAMLLADVRDAAVWQSREWLPFARTLQRAQAIGRFMQELPAGGAAGLRRSAPAVNVPLLTRSMDEFRGGLVQVRGEVVLAEPVPQQRETDLGPFFYHVVWIRPEGSAAIPFSIYLPADGPDAPPPLAVDPQRPVLFAAVPLKRLPYLAEAGIQVAPVLVAADYEVLDQPNSGEFSYERGDVASAQGGTPNSGESGYENATEAWAAMTLADPLVVGAADLRRRGRAVWQSPAQYLARREAVDALVLAPLRTLVGDDVSSAALADWIAGGSAAESPAEIRRGVAGILGGLARLDVDAEDSPLLEASGLPAQVSVKVDAADGLVEGLEVVPLPPELAEATGQREVYRLKLRRLDGGEPLTALASDVPDAWTTAVELRQYASLRGLKLKVDRGGGNVAEVLLADRVEWRLPAEGIEPASLRPSVDADMANLSRGGWDLATADLVASLQGRSLRGEEAEAFYSFAGAAAAVGPGEPTATLFECLAKPRERIAAELREQAWAIRVTRIAVDDADLRDALGAAEYYEVNALVDIGDRSVRLVSSADAEPIVFRGEFPVTLIATSLPAELSATPESVDASRSRAEDSLPGGDSQSWSVSQPIQFTGRFYRLWQYDSQETVQRTDGRTKLTAPIVMASSLQVRPGGPSQSQDTINLVFALVGSMVIAALVIARVMASSPKASSAEKPLRRG